MKTNRNVKKIYLMEYLQNVKKNKQKKFVFFGREKKETKKPLKAGNTSSDNRTSAKAYFIGRANIEKFNFYKLIQINFFKIWKRKNKILIIQKKKNLEIFVKFYIKPKFL